ncbi:MAG TPA: AMP-binding protein [Alphaproteobacteria bacterium]
MKPLTFATVSGLLRETARELPDSDLFAVPRWLQEKWRLPRANLTYRQVTAAVEAQSEHYRRAGYGAGHRVALLLENRPAHFVHWLALNSLGAGIVPLNPDYGADELNYALAHSESALVVALAERMAQVGPVAAALGVPAALDTEAALPPPKSAPPGGPEGKRAEAALLYTSGTTGRPKGCMLSNEYFLGWGEWYAAQRGALHLRRGRERLLQPLPTFHTNATGNSFMGMLISGGAQVILDRFHPKSWWQDAIETRATCFHYLGVMPAMLLNLPPSPHDRAHGIRFGMGGGLHASHHAAFERRFGVALLEGWAMTETGGGGTLCDWVEPRRVGGHCIGKPDRPGPPMEIRIVDDAGNEVAPGAPGNFLVRTKGPDPRQRFFTGYLKDEAATAAAWEGGWLNTGDIVRQDAAGNLYFVDRKKSIVRRSGENIATAEVEEVLSTHPAVGEASVLAVRDEIRGEEVMAVIVPRPAHNPDAALANAIFEHCRQRFAYYKAPGYIAFLSEMPVTATQKIRRSDLGDLAEHPERHPNCFDLRAKKQQSKARPAS